MEITIKVGAVGFWILSNFVHRGSMSLAELEDNGSEWTKEIRAVTNQLRFSGILKKYPFSSTYRLINHRTTWRCVLDESDKDHPILTSKLRDTAGNELSLVMKEFSVVYDESTRTKELVLESDNNVLY